MTASFTVPRRGPALRAAFASIALSLVAGAGLTASAQDEISAEMSVTRNGEQASMTGPSDWFTGTAIIDPVHMQTDEPSRITSARVTFTPGARTNWHTHPLGQLMVITSGQGWTQVEGGERVEVNAGDTVWCPPGCTHWHGATDETVMSHLVVQEALDGSNVEWGDAVTDAQYLGEK